MPQFMKDFQNLDAIKRLNIKLVWKLRAEVN